jgi:hypothetical protein
MISGTLAVALLAQAGVASAAQNGPVDLTAQAPAPRPSATSTPNPAPRPPLRHPRRQPPPGNSPRPPTPLPPPLAEWSVADAQALLAAIRGIGAEGLFSRDYEPTALAAAIAKGPGPISTPLPAACSSGWPKTCAMAAPR